MPTEKQKLPNKAQKDQELQYLASIAGACSKLAGGVNSDSFFAALLDDTNTTAIFKKWYAQENNGVASKYSLLTRFFEMCALDNDQQHTVRFYAASASSESAGTPLDWLAGKPAAPLATNENRPAPGWDAENRLTWYIRANALSLADGTMNVLHIEGVDAGFDITGEVAPVYTFQLAPWFREIQSDGYEIRSWRATYADGFRPYAWDVAPDGTKRAMTWHPTFGGGKTAAGKLTSGVARRVVNFTSALGGLSLARAWNNYEGVWNDGDTKFVLYEWQHRHFTKENSGYCEGCTSYDVSEVAAISETNVKRIVLSTAAAARFVVGSAVYIGSTNDRGNAACREASGGIVEILAINDINIGGTVYGEIVLNLNNDGYETISPVAGTTRITTMPWTTGATEVLPDHYDGSAGDLTSGKYPMRVAGIEMMRGAYEMGLDPLYNVTAHSGGGYDYTVFECKNSENLAGSITANYENTGITYEGMPSGWQYVKEFQQTDKAVLFPKTINGSSGGYYRSAFNGTWGAGVRCPWRFAVLGGGGIAGLACGAGNSAPSGSDWSGAPRLAGSGKKRGEWAGV